MGSFCVFVQRFAGVLCLLVVTGALEAQGLPKDPYHALVRLTHLDGTEALLLSVQSRVGLNEHFPLYLREHFAPLITIDGDTSTDLITGQETPRHYYGRLPRNSRAKKESTPYGVGASIIGKQLFVRFIGRRGRAFTINVSLPNQFGPDQFGTTFTAIAEIQRVRRSKTLPCEEPHEVRSSNGESGFFALPRAVQQDRQKRRVLEVATDADAEYYARYGDLAFAHIQSILNTVESIYLRELGIALRIRRQNVFTTKNGQPYTSARSELLLGQLQSYAEEHHHLGRADVAHLFSGKTLNAGVLGIAVLGTVCIQPSFSYSLSQAAHQSVNWIVVAHELAHNLGAIHDSNSASVMYPRVSPEHTSFSDFSKKQIASFLSYTDGLEHGSCLAPPGAPQLREEKIALSLERNTSAATSYELRSDIAGMVDGTCTMSLYASTDQEVLKTRKRYAQAKGLRRVGSWNIASSNSTLSLSFGENQRNAVRRRSRIFLQGEVVCADTRIRTARIVIRANGSFKKAIRTIRKTLQADLI